MALRINSNAKATQTVKVLLATAFLFSGCYIYLVFRTRTLNLYHWCDMIGLSKCIESARFAARDWCVPEFVKFSLPDGLYSAAYILMIDAIWYKDDGLLKNCIIVIIPLFTILSEILQYFGLVKGTFDLMDLICYATPLLIYIKVNIFHKLNL